MHSLMPTMDPIKDCSQLFKTRFKVLELYSGIGGMHFAIKNLPIDSYDLIAIDINTSANGVYIHNHLSHNCQQMERNILSINENHFNEWAIDLLTMSPPCQPFTRIRKLPKYILVENVKGFETSDARQLLIQTLSSCGYGYQEFLLSPNQLNVPNSRLRYYLIAKRGKQFNFNSNNEEFVAKPPDIDPKNLCSFCTNILFQSKDQNLRPISDYLENLDDIQIQSYLLPDKILSKYFMILDIVKSDSLSTNCFTKSYSHRIEGTGSVLQTSDHDIQEVCRQLNDCQTDEQKIVILRSLGLRFFTPKEISNLMSFPTHFDFPEDLTIKQKYRLLGNSVNVKVIEYLLKLLLNDCELKAQI
ncbi:unnamed protein product [Oppiella nova]|uniref:tRNA (cytosine(38)-C(5))-methyltransferase n=1 Tax=Oppiella nova TaxID=334625 RepID=A0A7R9MI62_9ACAR|nr:unnamed protein product [Oppiella nova]CAG2176836.1 unnamed protein product [Oppiella nova]